jgi:hypothetical protein
MLISREKRNPIVVPSIKTVRKTKLKSIGVESLVFDPCGNVPAQADFLTVMRANVNNLRKAF